MKKKRGSGRGPRWAAPEVEEEGRERATRTRAQRTTRKRPPPWRRRARGRTGCRARPLPGGWPCEGADATRMPNFSTPKHKGGLGDLERSRRAAAGRATEVRSACAPHTDRQTARRPTDRTRHPHATSAHPTGLPEMDLRTGNRKEGYGPESASHTSALGAPSNNVGIFVIPGNSGSPDTGDFLVRGVPSIARSASPRSANARPHPCNGALNDSPPHLCPSPGESTPRDVAKPNLEARSSPVRPAQPTGPAQPPELGKRRRPSSGQTNGPHVRTVCRKDVARRRPHATRLSMHLGKMKPARGINECDGLPGCGASWASTWRWKRGRRRAPRAKPHGPLRPSATLAQRDPPRHPVGLCANGGDSRCCWHDAPSWSSLRHPRDHEDSEISRTFVFRRAQ